MNNGSEEKSNCWLHRFAVLAAIATFLLLGAGGLVTSHEAGMSVPDWPNSYGYNMFAFPPSKWIGGIFYEHTHRLWATAVGLMTTILAVWILLKDPRKWMKWLGVAAFLLVVAQGVLGGLRVVLNNAHLGIVHGVVGQSYFVLMCAHRAFHQRPVAKDSGVQEIERSAPFADPGLGGDPSDFCPTHSRRDDAGTARRPVHFRFSARPRATLAGHQPRRH